METAEKERLETVEKEARCGGLITTCPNCNGTGRAIVMGGPSRPCFCKEVKLK